MNPYQELSDLTGKYYDARKDRDALRAEVEAARARLQRAESVLYGIAPEECPGWATGERCHQCSWCKACAYFELRGWPATALCDAPPPADSPVATAKESDESVLRKRTFLDMVETAGPLPSSAMATAQSPTQYAPSNGFLAPVWARLDALNLDYAILERRIRYMEEALERHDYGGRIDALSAKVTALEEWSRQSYLRDHRLAEPMGWKGCHLCNGLTIGTCGVCEKRICSNHVKHCDTCKAAPPAPVADRFGRAVDKCDQCTIERRWHGPEIKGHDFVEPGPVAEPVVCKTCLWAICICVKPGTARPVHVFDSCCATGYKNLYGHTCVCMYGLEAGQACRERRDHPIHATERK